MPSISRTSIFTAILFISSGLGLIYGEFAAGVLIGLGAGLVAVGFIGLARGRSRMSNSAAIVIGLFFLLDGLWKLGLVPFALSLRSAAGALLVVIGVLLLIDAFK
ncbi:MAG: hypothetical protein F7C38_02525 [Desulfurococcales archaeon]|nr:hypothetical protein [Desulfurococcales archaeon]